MVEEILEHIVDQPIAVLPIGVKNMGATLKKIAIDYKIMAVVADGSLTGYAGGLEVKKYLLVIEQHHKKFF